MPSRPVCENQYGKYNANIEKRDARADVNAEYAHDRIVPIGIQSRRDYCIETSNSDRTV